jgi:hypothetical protein
MRKGLDKEHLLVEMIAQAILDAFNPIGTITTSSFIKHQEKQEERG